MISIDSAQIDAWIVAFIFPLSRILGFIATAPLWSSNGVPRRVRLVLGLAITIALTPSLPPMPAVQPASWAGCGSWPSNC
jgi:flagellar biosynthetic protein FliR